jgi:hypothetical protein
MNKINSWYLSIYAASPVCDVTKGFAQVKKKQTVKIMKRVKIIFAILVLYLFIFSSPVHAQELELEYEFLCEVTALLDNPIEIGNTPIGKRTIHPIRGGTVEGPLFKGKVLPNGADWLLMIDSSTAKLDVRAVVETDEGEKIYAHYGGFIHFYSDGSYYFRTNPEFETASEKYAWLNHTMAVGVGKLIEGGVAYKIYLIK